MSHATHDPLFDRPGIGPITQHFKVVVTFEHKNVTVSDRHLHIRWYIAQVGRDGHANSVRFKNKTDRVSRVVRNRERRDRNVANGESAARRKILHSGEPAWIFLLGRLL